MVTNDEKKTAFARSAAGRENINLLLSDHLSNASITLAYRVHPLDKV
jgi:hypothetical protein